MPDLNIENDLNYTFVRENKEKNIQQILEYKDNRYTWTNDLNNCLGYFSGKCINESLSKELNSCIDDGWKIYCNSFDANGQHIETIE